MANENNECVTRSNQLWAIDRIKLNIAIKVADNHICNPLLDLVIDLYSECVAGYKLDVASHSPVLTALRHAILPKDAQAQYNTHCEWDVYGIPEGIVIDRVIDPDSSALDQIARQLGCHLHKSVRPSEGGLVERFFNAVDRNLLSQLPGYQENPHERSTVNHDTYLDLQQVEQVVGSYIVDNYNQQPYPKAPSQTRSQRWKGGLPNQPSIPSEQIFDSLLASPLQGCV